MQLPVNEFFSTDDFAETVHYTNANGVTRDIAAIVDISAKTTLAGEVGYESAGPHALFRSIDVNDADHSATVVIDAELVDENGDYLVDDTGAILLADAYRTYKVKEVNPDGTGITDMLFSEDTP